MTRNPAAATGPDPDSRGGFTSTAWTSWFGALSCLRPLGRPTLPLARWSAMAHRHASKMVRPRPVRIRCAQLSPPTAINWADLPMEPEAPWAVDQAIESRTGNGAPVQDLGTVKPDDGGQVNPVFPLNDRYLALDAYKFDVPNTESTLPGSTCPSCSPTACQTPPTPGPLAPWRSWSRALVGQSLQRTRNRDIWVIIWFESLGSMANSIC